MSLSLNNETEPHLLWWNGLDYLSKNSIKIHAYKLYNIIKKEEMDNSIFGEMYNKLLLKNEILIEERLSGQTDNNPKINQLEKTIIELNKKNEFLNSKLRDNQEEITELHHKQSDRIRQLHREQQNELSKYRKKIEEEREYFKKKLQENDDLMEIKLEKRVGPIIKVKDDHITAQQVSIETLKKQLEDIHKDTIVNTVNVKKGKKFEDESIEIWQLAFPTAEIIDVAGQGHRGDQIISDAPELLGKTIMGESKSHDSGRVPKKDIEKFFNNVDNNDDINCGIMLVKTAKVTGRDGITVEYSKKGKPVAFVPELTLEGDINIQSTLISTVTKFCCRLDNLDKDSVSVLEIAPRANEIIKNFRLSLNKLKKDFKEHCEKSEKTITDLLDLLSITNKQNTQDTQIVNNLNESETETDLYIKDLYAQILKYKLKDNEIWYCPCCKNKRNTELNFMTKSKSDFNKHLKSKSHKLKLDLDNLPKFEDYIHCNNSSEGLNP